MKDNSLDDFNQAMNAGEGATTVVLFYGSWLPEAACKDMLATYDALSSRFREVKLLRFSVNEQTHIPMALGVKAIPAIFSFKGNALMDNKYGFMNDARMAEFIQQAVDGGATDEY